MQHDLKVWPPFFNSLECGIKTFEARKDDRCFEVGDTLRLREFDPGTGTYSGRELLRRISYKLNGGGDFGVAKGFCILAIQPLT